MNINSELTGINVYYTTHLTFILETVISTMQFWGYDTFFMEEKMDLIWICFVI
ncbi:MAG: hypothetical protein HWN81_08695 [Candidatus Lokiarchaeota archaeon]|nr:hypothetical protein [Candidatus Lokiarchaeota archaeon]